MKLHVQDRMLTVLLCLNYRMLCIFMTYSTSYCCHYKLKDPWNVCVCVWERERERECACM